MVNELLFASASRQAKAIREGRLSSVELVDACLAQVKRHNPSLRALVTLDEVGARRQAHRADEALARGELWGPLHGVVVTLKDSFCTAGMRTTAGHPPLQDHLPERDSTVAARLKGAGAVLLGKSNLSELAFDYQSDNPLFGRTLNPWDPTRTAGGSSGGSAVAVATGMSALDIGSDIGGSIRLPSHFCGLFALKPTEHRVSQAGHIPPLPGTTRTVRVMEASGPIARSVEDLALAFHLIAGADGRDTEVPPLPVRPVVPLPLEETRIAWTPNFPGVPTSEVVRKAIERLATELSPLAKRVVRTIPEIDYEEQWAARHQLRSLMDVFDSPVSRNESSRLASYFHALRERDRFIAHWEAFFAEWDVFLCPVTMIPAFSHCPTHTPIPVDDAVVDYWWVGRFCNLFGYTGHPVVVLPLTKLRDGLPVGIQVVGRRWEDEALLAASMALEQVTGPFHVPPGYV